MNEIKLSNGLNAVIEIDNPTDTIPRSESRKYVVQYSNGKWGTIWFDEDKLDDVYYLKDKIEKYYERDLKNYNQMPRS